MNEINLVNAPAQFATARCMLRKSELAMVDDRVAWALRTSAMFEFTPNWRRSIDPALAMRSLRSEMDAMARGEELIYNAYESASGAYVGRIDLHTWDFDAPRCEIGYMADAANCGRGLLRESCLALIEWALSQGVARVQALCDANNHRSIAFAQSLGMQQEGVMRNYGRNGSGELYDEVVLAMVRDPEAN
ncbi:MAG: N-acetyltransferase [Burkholderiales bacterium]|nr:MAG: N-acetyltransferase [Burkholderiales bacterium]